jgi:hypothetical protein
VCGGRPLGSLSAATGREAKAVHGCPRPGASFCGGDQAGLAAQHDVLRDIPDADRPLSLRGYARLTASSPERKPGSQSCATSATSCPYPLAAKLSILAQPPVEGRDGGGDADCPCSRVGRVAGEREHRGAVGDDRHLADVTGPGLGAQPPDRVSPPGCNSVRVSRPRGMILPNRRLWTRASGGAGGRSQSLPSTRFVLSVVFLCTPGNVSDERAFLAGVGNAVVTMGLRQFPLEISVPDLACGDNLNARDWACLE